MKRPALSVLLALLLAAAPAAPALAAPLPAGGSTENWEKLVSADGALKTGAVQAESAILIDGNTGKPLFEKNADKKQYPASTTKIMTCLVCLQSLPDGRKPSDVTVTVGDLPAEDFINGSENIALQKGERITLEGLLSMMMVYSGNDCADAVALWCGGTVQKFADMMNEEAAKLGMDNSHFTNPNGLADDKDHYTTARDMARLATEAMKNPYFRKYVKLTSYKIGPTNKTPDARTKTTTDYLLLKTVKGETNKNYYSYALGVKTGYTGMAQNAFISAAQKDGQYLISAVMNEDIRDHLWPDTTTMFDYGFAYYDTMDLMDVLKGREFSVDVKNAATDDPGGGRLALEPDAPENHYYSGDRILLQSLKNDPSQFEVTQAIPPCTAPVSLTSDGARTVLGTVTVSYQGVKLMQCNLLATRDVAVLQPATPTPSVSAPAQPTPSAPLESAHAQTPAAQTQAPAPVPRPAGPSAGRILLWALAAVIFLLAVFVAVRLTNLRRGSRSARGRSRNARGRVSTRRL